MFCRPDQTFFCIDKTHYRPCVSLDSLSNLQKAGDYYCGSGRCCEAGAASPCTYSCQRQRVDYRNTRVPWKLSRLKRKKRRRTVEPLSSEEIDRLNKIVSVKSFIIRQKDLEDWEENDDDYEDDLYKWRPSYRTFCRVRTLSDKSDGKGSQITLTVPTETIKELNVERVPNEMVTQPNFGIVTHPMITVTNRITTTTKRSTTRRTTKRRMPKKKRKTTKKSSITTFATSLPCTSSIFQRKMEIDGTCQDYLVCTKNRRGAFEWKFYTCPPYEFFSKEWQMCKKMETVPCVFNRNQRRNLRFTDF